MPKFGDVSGAVSGLYAIRVRLFGGLTEKKNAFACLPLPFTLFLHTSRNVNFLHMHYIPIHIRQ
jgi:hypothetical protein